MNPGEWKVKLFPPPVAIAEPAGGQWWHWPPQIN